MPALLFVLYLVSEAVAFWLVSKWLGTGWALIAFFATMFVGMVWAGMELRRIMTSRLTKDASGNLQIRPQNPGKTASNLGLTFAGGALVSLPGFLSFILGAFLIFPPTRSLIRKGLALGFFRFIEKVGLKMYEASPVSDATTSYGSFAEPTTNPHMRRHPSQSGKQSSFQSGDDEDLVIDEDEIRRWADEMNPEDFGSDSDSKGTQD